MTEKEGKLQNSSLTLGKNAPQTHRIGFWATILQNSCYGALKRENRLQGKFGASFKKHFKTLDCLYQYIKEEKNGKNDQKTIIRCDSENSEDLSEMWPTGSRQSCDGNLGS